MKKKELKKKKKKGKMVLAAGTKEKGIQKDIK